MFELSALFKLSGMEFQNKAPLYLNEFLPTSKAENLKLNAIAKIIAAIATTKKPNYVIW